MTHMAFQRMRTQRGMFSFHKFHQAHPTHELEHHIIQTELEIGCQSLLKSEHPWLHYICTDSWL